MLDGAPIDSSLQLLATRLMLGHSTAYILHDKDIADVAPATSHLVSEVSA